MSRKIALILRTKPLKNNTTLPPSAFPVDMEHPSTKYVQACRLERMVSLLAATTIRNDLRSLSMRLSSQSEPKSHAVILSMLSKTTFISEKIEDNPFLRRDRYSLHYKYSLQRLLLWSLGTFHSTEIFVCQVVVSLMRCIYDFYMNRNVMRSTMDSFRIVYV